MVACSHFHCRCDKILSQGSFRKQGFIGSQVRVQSIMAAGQEGAGHRASAVGKQGIMNASVQLAFSFVFKFPVFLFCMSECFVCMHVCVPQAFSACRSQKRASDSPGTGVTKGCEPPYGCWESNPGRSSGRRASALTSELSLQPPVLHIKNCLAFDYVFV